MRTHPIARLVPSLALLAACAEVAPVAPPSTPSLARNGAGGHTVVEQPISWSLPYFVPGQEPQPDPSLCSLSTTVQGTGTIRIVTKTVETGNGRVRMSISSSASGTATGADGSTYRWTYDQKVRDFDAATLPGSFPVTDQFHLMGQNGAPSYKTVFHALVLFDANGEFAGIESASKERGNYLRCDPI